MTRIQTIARALDQGTPLSFVYMPKGKGLAAIRERTIEPLAINQSREGRTTVLGETGEPDDRGRTMREFRVDRMFHVTTNA